MPSQPISRDPLQRGSPSEGSGVPGPVDDRVRRELSQLRRAFDSMSVGLALLDRDLRYITINEELARINGAPVKTHIGRLMSDIIPDIAALAEPLMRKVIETGEPAFDLEISGRQAAAGEEVRHWLCDFVPVRGDDAGDVEALSTVVHDVTDKKRVEIALRESEGRFRALAESVPHMVWTARPDGFIEYYNQAALDYAGRTNKDVEDRRETWLDFVHPDERDAVAHAWLLAVTTDGDYRVDFRIRRADGQYLWHLAHAVPVRDDGGEIVEWLGTCTNIDDRKRAEEKLRESERRLAQTIGTSPVGIFFGRSDGTIRECNDALLQLLGYTRSDLEAQGLSWGAIVPARDGSGEGVLEIESLSEVGTIGPLEVTLLRKDGTKLSSLACATCLGVNEEHVAFVVDLTERKRAEEALREADRQKDHFLATLGHELRNPLAAIRNAADVLGLMAIEDAKIGRMRQVIERQSKHMARLIDGLLDISRVARGKITLNLQAIDLARIVREVLGDHTAQISRRGITLAAELPETPIWAQGDRTRLAQVFDNLVSNAIKFTDHAGSLSVKVSEEEDGALVTVRDTGVGIDEDAVERIFEPFHQARHGSARGGGGLGLGLALARALVELHGGRIHAQSHGPRQGSEFSVWLPLAQQPPFAQDAAPQSSAAVATRILVVDDNRDSADVLRDVLSLAGHQVTVAYDGRQAIEVARRFVPRVILCDIGLPDGMSGYDVACAVRQDPDLREVHLIAVTGFGRADDRARALRAGFDAHLTKPVSLERIEVALSKLSAKRIGRDTSPDSK